MIHYSALHFELESTSRLVARKLEDASLGLFAAPSYLALDGTPKTLIDLSKHACIAFVLPSTDKVLPWLSTPLETSTNKAEPIEFIPVGPVHIA